MGDVERLGSITSLTGTFFELSREFRPLGKVLPSRCSVVELQSLVPTEKTSAIQFWHGSRSQKIAKRNEQAAIADAVLKAATASKQVDPLVLSIADCAIGSDREESMSESESSDSDDSDVIDLAVEKDPSDAGSHQESESEIKGLVLEHVDDGDGLGMPIPLVPIIPAPLVAVPAHAPLDAPLPEPPLEPPKWSAGVERVEISARTAKCCFCDGVIPKLVPRFLYKLFKSQPKYAHAECWDRVPLSQVLHSRAMLKYQRDNGPYIVGPHSVAVNNVIETSLGPA